MSFTQWLKNNPKKYALLIFWWFWIATPILFVCEFFSLLRHHKIIKEAWEGSFTFMGEVYCGMWNIIRGKGKV